MARREELAERPDVAASQSRNGRAHTLVLARDVPETPRMSRLQLAPPFRIAGAFVGVSLAGVDDDERDVLGQPHPSMFECAAVEKERVLGAPEQRRRLVENAGRHPDRALLCPLTRAYQLERLELEICNRTERKREHDHERPGRAEARSARKVGIDVALDPDGGPPEVSELLGYGGDVAAPTAHLAAAVRSYLCDFAVRDERDPGRRRDGDADAELDRDRQDEAAAVVGVLADQVDPARSPEALLHGILRLMAGPKVAFIGAGSTEFARKLAVDILSCPDLAEHATLALMDVDPDRLRVSETVVRSAADRLGAKRANIVATLDRRTALDSADYVVTMMQVGGYRPSTVIDFDVPKQFGLRQTIGDTLGVGGIMRGLRTIPVLLDVCRDMEELCPEALLLQHVNPMAILCWAIARASSIRAVGLCHSVQGTARDLASDLGVPPSELEYVCAGINHLAFYLELRHRGRNLYPELRRVLDEDRVPEWNRVRYELFRYFGYFSTESSEHLAEYVPWFIKQSRPDLIETFNIPLDEYPRRCEQNIAEWERLRAGPAAKNPAPIRRSDEYAARIIHASETGERFAFNGNVPNDRLITDLPAGCCVEVPCIADEHGITPQAVGSLPLHLAALIHTNVNVQALTVEAALSERRDHVDHAAMLDPHTGAELSLAEIHELVEALLGAHGGWIPPFH